MHSLDLFVFVCILCIAYILCLSVYFVLLFFILHICCVIVSTSGIEAQSLGPLFLQCFDAVGWVFTLLTLSLIHI